MTEGQSGRVKDQQEVDKATGDNRGPQGPGNGSPLHQRC